MGPEMGTSAIRQRQLEKALSDNDFSLRFLDRFYSICIK